MQMLDKMKPKSYTLRIHSRVQVCRPPKKADTWERVSAMNAVIEAFFLSLAWSQVQGRLLIGLAE